MKDVDEMEILVETERMLGKYRFNYGESLNETKPLPIVPGGLGVDAPSKVETPLPPTDSTKKLDIHPPLNPDPKRHKLRNKKKEALERDVRKLDAAKELRDDLWAHQKNRMSFNPLDKSLNFNNMNATDYKLNKRINLPKPLSIDEEFRCEIRRRAYIKSFKDFKNVKQESPNNKKKGSSP